MQFLRIFSTIKARHLLSLSEKTRTSPWLAKLRGSQLQGCPGEERTGNQSASTGKLKVLSYVKYFIAHISPALITIKHPILSENFEHWIYKGIIISKEERVCILLEISETVIFNNEIQKFKGKGNDCCFSVTKLFRTSVRWARARGKII